MQVFKNKDALLRYLIAPEDTVLDIGFWGQGVTAVDAHWPHRILKTVAREVYGLDLDFDESQLEHPENYQRGSAENFSFAARFDKIFAGDLIEHLSNPGLFLDSCAKNLKASGQLILTTPNCFNLFNLAEKLTKTEPTVNKDHTCYFNQKTLPRLLEKNGWQVVDIGFLYSLEAVYPESWKKKVLNFVYYLLSLVTSKFIGTLVVVAAKTTSHESH